MHEVVYPDDVRMRQFETALCLALELIQQRSLLDHKVGKKFQRDLALQFFVARQPHNSHSASPEDLDQRVASKNFLSAGELTRCRVCDVTHALVSHLGNISVIRIERKVKASSGGCVSRSKSRTRRDLLHLEKSVFSLCPSLRAAVIAEWRSPRKKDANRSVASAGRRAAETDEAIEGSASACTEQK